jgi:xylan 1,4-beta-xylosidase
MNTFKFLAKLGTQLVDLSVSPCNDPDKYKDYWGTGEGAEINGWATISGEKSLSALIYCHEDSWATDGLYPVEFTAENLPFNGPYKITHYRIDKDHSNAYAEWVRQGRPNWPVAGQYEAIKARSELELLEPVKTVVPLDGKLKLEFTLPVKSVSFVVIESVE